MNRTSQKRLTKAMRETGKSCVDLLPDVLCEIRMTSRATALHVTARSHHSDLIIGCLVWSCHRVLPKIVNNADSRLGYSF